MVSGIILLPKRRMASSVLLGRFLFAFLVLGLHPFLSSGTLVGFSYDAGEEIATPLSAQGAIFKVFMENLPSSNVSVSLCMNQHELMQILESKGSSTPRHRHNLLATLTELNSDTVIVRSNGLDVPSLLSALALLRSSLETPGLGNPTRISVMFSLSTLGTLHRTRHKSLQNLMQVLKEWESHVVVEAPVVGELSLGDEFVHSTVKMALSSCTYLPLLDVPFILVLKISENPGEVNMVEFMDLVSKFLRDSLHRRRIFGLFVDLSDLRQSKPETLGLKEELKFPSLHRLLLEHGRMLVASTKTTIHDMYPPLTNPVTAPITIPSTNPAPAVVTVPSTNPVSVFPTNPTMSPVTVPPVSTPITVPATNPYPTPVVPVTNPTTTPVTYPMSPPVTNPATGYPFTSPVSTPSTVPPFTVPSTVPFAPTVAGQTWCVAKSGVMDAALQIALDYACGIGGADCSTIQPTGSCSYPDSLQAHASYAFNSYYQRNPVSTSCDFGGTAMLVNVNPSSGTCNYPTSTTSSSSSTTTPSTSSSLPAYNPTSTTPSSTPGSGSSVLNTYSPSGSNSVFGSNNLTSSVNNAQSQSARWTYLAFVLIVAYISYIR